MIDIKTALDHATHRLTSTSPSARLDAELILTHVLNVSRVFLYAHSEDKLATLQQQHYQDLLQKRMAGVPIAYLIGTREFWSLPLRVSNDTLIPRPETEVLVERVLNQFIDVTQANILDLGTGTGAIALALASERPDWTLLAVDKNEPAVKIARENTFQLGLSNLSVLCSNWFEAIPAQQFNAIVSNPPYLAADDPHLGQGDVRFEPRDALISGRDGLDDLNHIIKHSCNWLLPDGWLFLEHGCAQGPAVTSMLEECGYQKVQCWHDWQGHDRVSGGCKKK